MTEPQTQEQAQAPLGTPQFQVVLADKFGGQKTEEIKVDSNRLSPVAEERLLWVDSLAIPARAEDILLQSAVWIGGSGFAVSVLRSLPPMIELLFPIVALLLIALGVTAYAWWAFKNLRPFIVYRLLLAAIGMAMGVLL